jgi:hypothetical protein
MTAMCGQPFQATDIPARTPVRVGKSAVAAAR